MSKQKDQNLVIDDQKEATQKSARPIYEEVDERDIDHILKQELEEQGLEYRFIDFKQAKINGGRSRAGWIVYKRQSPDPRLQGIAALADPDGLVRQGTMVLAVKTKGAAEKQRKRIKEQRDILNRYNKTVTEEVDAEAKNLGGSSRAVIGYDKNS